MNATSRLIPARLEPGDTVGVAAPAGPFEAKPLLRGAAVLESMGFKVRMPSDPKPDRGYLAASDARRAEELHGLFADPDIRGIVCARGGYGAMRILDRLDGDLIGRHPKVLIGFSDITALLVTLYQRWGLVTFHGPMVTSLARAGETTRRALAEAVCGSAPLAFDLADGTTVHSGIVRGPFMAANLTTLCHLIGTPFEPDLAGHVLMIEDCGEAPYRIDRMLTQMRLAGCFDDLAGLLLGTFSDGASTEDVVPIVADIFGDRPVPTLAGIAAGHGEPNLTLPVGLEAALDADRKRLVFHRPATADRHSPQGSGPGAREGSHEGR